FGDKKDLTKKDREFTSTVLRSSMSSGTSMEGDYPPSEGQEESRLLYTRNSSSLVLDSMGLSSGVSSTITSREQEVRVTGERSSTSSTSSSVYVCDLLVMKLEGKDGRSEYALVGPAGEMYVVRSASRASRMSSRSRKSSTRTSCGRSSSRASRRGSSASRNTRTSRRKSSRTTTSSTTSTTRATNGSAPGSLEEWSSTSSEEVENEGRRSSSRRKSSTSSRVSCLSSVALDAKGNCVLRSNYTNTGAKKSSKKLSASSFSLSRLTNGSRIRVTANVTTNRSSAVSSVGTIDIEDILEAFELLQDHDKLFFADSTDHFFDVSSGTRRRSARASRPANETSISDIKTQQEEHLRPLSAEVVIRDCEIVNEGGRMMLLDPTTGRKWAAERRNQLIRRS
ncbi:unnamed protein product, partial [Amoebophrya sp. A25]